MPLCPPCQNFSVYSFSTDPDGIRGYRLEEVVKGATEQCGFCTLLAMALKDDIACLPWPLSDTWIRLSLINDSGTISKHAPGLRYNKLQFKLVIRPLPKPRRLADADDGGKLHELAIAADPDAPAAQNLDVTGRYLGEDPISELHISTILRWLDECSDHKECNRTNSGTVQLHPRNAPLPTRCIEVLGQNLVLRDTKGHCGTYITLSHRWNIETEKCKTTMRNLSERQISVDPATLSKTFQHALLITQRLGVQYIWIDSICIIQDGDDGKDWRTEALKMGQYYQYSILTIAVTSSSPQHGFLEPRPQKPFSSLARLPYRDISGVQKGYFYAYKRDIAVDEQFLSAVWNSELLRRGWVFQEWILSRRIVYFTPSLLFFECQTHGSRNECGDKIQLRRLPTNFDKSFSLKTGVSFSTSTIESIWYRILEIYSRLRFTVAGKDRIIALSGVASEVREIYIAKDQESQERKPLAYVSGLWLRDIHYGLLWQQKSATKEYTRIQGLPSWSWSSFLHEVRWPERYLKPQHELKVTTLITTDGAVSPVDNIEEASEASSSSSHLLQLNPMDTSQNPAQHGVDSIVVSLGTKGKLQPMIVRGPFRSKEDVRLVAWATGVKISDQDTVSWVLESRIEEMDPAALEAALGLDFQARPWRAISSMRSPDIICGWGSFEQLLVEEPSSTAGGNLAQVIHVSTENGVRGGLGFGHLSLTHDVYNVLFVEHTGGYRYRRIGVGKLFDKDMMKDFAEVEEQEIELI